MKHRYFLLVPFLVAVGLFAAYAPQAGEIPPIPSAIVHGDPTEGQASLMNRLGDAGAQVELGDPVGQDFFTVKGRIIKVNGMDVQVFEYASLEAMEVDAAQVSADGYSVGTSMISWMATPHFFKSDTMIVLYVGDDVTMTALLESVLGAQFAGG